MIGRQHAQFSRQRCPADGGVGVSVDLQLPAGRSPGQVDATRFLNRIVATVAVDVALFPRMSIGCREEYRR